MYNLSPLPYSYDALEPVLDKETLEYHHDKHQQAYIDKANALVPGTEFEGKSLEEIVKTAPAGPVYNNAAQAINHELYWNQFQSPREDNRPSGALLEALEQRWGSFEAFQTAFETSGLNNFGSGWTRLVKNADGSLEILNTSNAGNPLSQGKTPLLGIDVWEHSYYIGYRNRRADYLKGCRKLINWDVVAKQY
ncbi:MAG: superoxide dismutase [Candidatus Absconditabacteria bacterium]|nr:superoxide dismutase [Candidatus Absconditabacteria bacterium]MDD3868608.1 superoxide dismutase [Candidatus Absconditabacteria bacterium]MDD4714723.1 superoxide dismutase [Candidatus Absconditabacteria bacterium]